MKTQASFERNERSVIRLKRRIKKSWNLLQCDTPQLSKEEWAHEEKLVAIARAHAYNINKVYVERRETQLYQEELIRAVIDILERRKEYWHAIYWVQIWRNIKWQYRPKIYSTWKFSGEMGTPDGPKTLKAFFKRYCEDEEPSVAEMVLNDKSIYISKLDNGQHFYSWDGESQEWYPTIYEEVPEGQQRLIKKKSVVKKLF